MKYPLLLGFVFLLFSASQALAQINIEEDPVITRMMERYVEVNKSTKSIQGWRIQVFATADRQQFELIKRRFESQYPYISTSWEHTKPFYKLRAGAFASKLEAMQMMQLIKRDYPNSYPAIDNRMSPTELLH
ncbi:MAG: SPOR domain-containing protein [Bacteroidota bacterium]